MQQQDPLERVHVLAERDLVVPA
eukprot:SAG22_NODE_1486_length_4323_cov_3.859848_1_plen_22_part_10